MVGVPIDPATISISSAFIENNNTVCEDFDNKFKQKRKIFSDEINAFLTKLSQEYRDELTADLKSAYNNAKELYNGNLISKDAFIATISKLFNSAYNNNITPRELSY